MGETEQEGTVGEKEGDLNLAVSSPKVHTPSSTPKYHGCSFPSILVVPRI